VRHWATCHRPTGGICSRHCGCACHRPPTAPAYDWATEVDPEPAGIPAHWWALGAVCSTVAAAVGHVRARWWWPWP